MSIDNIDYYTKYLKYKNKYLTLKNKLGGSSKSETGSVMTPIQFYKIAYSKLMTRTGSSHCSRIPGTKATVDKFDKMNITDILSNPKASDKLKEAAEKYKNEASTFGQLKSNLQSKEPTALDCKKNSSPFLPSFGSSSGSYKSWVPSASNIVDSVVAGMR